MKEEDGEGQERKVYYSEGGVVVENEEVISGAERGEVVSICGRHHINLSPRIY